MSENSHNSLIMIGKAFCGNGFIHLNIAEIHEDSIGGLENVGVFYQSGHEMSDLTSDPRFHPRISKRRVHGCP